MNCYVRNWRMETGRQARSRTPLPTPEPASERWYGAVPARAIRPRTYELPPPLFEPTPFRLTTREYETLRAVVDFGGNKEAAAALGISPLTVRNHLNAAFRKVGSTGGMWGALAALGWLTPPADEQRAVA